MMNPTSTDIRDWLCSKDMLLLQQIRNKVPREVSNCPIAWMMLRRVKTQMIVDQRSDQEVIEQVSSLQPPAKKSKIKKGAVSTVSANKKWSRKDEHGEALIGYIKDYKTLCDFKSIDFEADLKELYSAVCSSMAHRFPSEFGPDKVTEPSTCVKDWHVFWRVWVVQGNQQNYAGKDKISRAYERIKSKIKGIRQDYRTAISKGTRSGSRKIKKEHFDTLCDIWSRSPTTVMLPEGVDGDSLTVTSDNEETNKRERKGWSCCN